MLNLTPLARRALAGLATFQAALALLIFVPRWSLRFWEAWLYWTLFSVCVLFITVYFLEHDPALIERRLQAGPVAETEKTQKVIQSAASALLCALFVVSGLDRRLGWSTPLSPMWVLAADALVTAGFAIIFLAFRENTHASSVVEVGTGQEVVATGPYRLVRHPMYTGAILLFMATPVALGSLWALVPAAAMAAVIIVRLLDEERFLAKHLSGYRAYCQTVRYHLLPGIW